MVVVVVIMVRKIIRNVWFAGIESDRRLPFGCPRHKAGATASLGIPVLTFIPELFPKSLLLRPTDRFASPFRKAGLAAFDPCALGRSVSPHLQRKSTSRLSGCKAEASELGRASSETPGKSGKLLWIGGDLTCPLGEAESRENRPEIFRLELSPAIPFHDSHHLPDPLSVHVSLGEDLL